MENAGADLDQTGSSEKLARMARLFHLLGTDCQQNIDIILTQTCHILGGACALYHRFGDTQHSRSVWAGSDCPEPLEKTFDKQDSLSFEAAVKGMDNPILLPDLETAFLFETKPFVQKYHLKSCLGFPVTLKKTVIGSLCSLDTKTRTFTQDEIHCIQTLAAALSREEERLSVEKELLEGKQRYKILVETVNDAIFIIQDGLVKFANPKTIALSGYTPDELGNLPFTDLVHPDDRKKILQNHIRRLNGEAFQSTYSFRILDKNRNAPWVQVNAVKFLWEGEPAILGCIRDISQIKDLEEKLLNAKKMELIGTIAGGVAHDLNNILSGLVSYPELLLMQISPDSPLKEPISFMHDAGLKAAEIVQDLLTLTRRGISAQESICLTDVIQEYFNSPAHKQLEKNYPRIAFRTRSEADLFKIIGSPSHITKIIMNLVINAAEAISQKGLVRVETFNRYVDIPLSGYDTILEGEYVVLKVTDNGAGISQEDLSRIFEPFYTKKQMGRSGSGLGLSVVWNSVKDHQGYIEIKTKINQGTTFEVYFPASRKKTETARDTFLIDDFKGNGESVLVIDDVDEQRRIARDSLKMLGYTPFTAASGEEALLFLKDRAVDMILLDMKMEPGIDGLETYKRILALHPFQKAIIASGFSESERVKETQRLGAGQYIKKPYTIKNLALALKKEASSRE